MLKIHKGIFEYIFLITIFFFSVALFDMPGYIFAGLVLLMFLLYIKKIELTVSEILLIMFSASYFLFYWLHYGVDINKIILYLFGPWCAYLIGKLYISFSNNKNSFLVFIFVIAIGMYLHGVLNVIAYIRSDYFLLYNYYRQSVDFWRRELVNVKTTEMLYTFATGACLGVLFSTYKMWVKIICSVVIAISLLLTVFLANRSLLIIFVVLFAWRLICWLSDSHVMLRKKIIAVIALAVILAVLISLIALNIGGLGEWFYSMKIVQRFVSDAELTRFDVWHFFFDDLVFIAHPFGGKDLTQNMEHGYFHNMWLDVYNVVGIIPFILLIVICIKIAVSCFSFSKVMKAADKKNESVIFTSLMFAILLNMMVEPIIEANPYYFLSVLMYCGAMEKYMYKVLYKEGERLDEKQYS